MKLLLTNNITKMIGPSNTLKLHFKKIWDKITGNKEKEDIFQETINYLKMQDETFSSGEKHLFKNFVSFNKKVVEDIMIPRTDIIAVRNDINLKDLIDIINKNSLTRTLVYQDTLDNIVGFIHIKDLFKMITLNQSFELSKIIRKPIISTHVVQLWELFKEMQAKRTQIAIVIDEYGGLDGIVSIEDIIREIFGNIIDEHGVGQKNNSYKIITPNTIIVSGRMEIEILENLLGVVLRQENDEFDTIGGLAMAKAGRVLSNGDKINISEDVEMEVIDSNARTIKTLKLTLKNTNIP